MGRRTWWGFVGLAVVVLSWTFAASARSQEALERRDARALAESFLAALAAGDAETAASLFAPLGGADGPGRAEGHALLSRLLDSWSVHEPHVVAVARFGEHAKATYRWRCSVDGPRFERAVVGYLERSLELTDEEFAEARERHADMLPAWRGEIERPWQTLRLVSDDDGTWRLESPVSSNPIWFATASGAESRMEAAFLWTIAWADGDPSLMRMMAAEPADGPTAVLQEAALRASVIADYEFRGERPSGVALSWSARLDRDAFVSIAGELAATAAAAIEDETDRADWLAALRAEVAAQTDRWAEWVSRDRRELPLTRRDGRWYVAAAGPTDAAPQPTESPADVAGAFLAALVEGDRQAAARRLIDPDDADDEEIVAAVARSLTAFEVAEARIVATAVGTRTAKVRYAWSCQFAPEAFVTGMIDLFALTLREEALPADEVEHELNRLREWLQPMMATYREYMQRERHTMLLSLSAGQWQVQSPAAMSFGELDLTPDLSTPTAAFFAFVQGLANGNEDWLGAITRNGHEEDALAVAALATACVIEDWDYELHGDDEATFYLLADVKFDADAFLAVFLDELEHKDIDADHEQVREFARESSLMLADLFAYRRLRVVLERHEDDEERWTVSTVDHEADVRERTDPVAAAAAAHAVLDALVARDGARLGRLVEFDLFSGDPDEMAAALVALFGLTGYQPITATVGDGTAKVFVQWAASPNLTEFFEFVLQHSLQRAREWGADEEREREVREEHQALVDRYGEQMAARIMAPIQTMLVPWDDESGWRVPSYELTRMVIPEHEGVASEIDDLAWRVEESIAVSDHDLFTALLGPDFGASYDDAWRSLVDATSVLDWHFLGLTESSDDAGVLAISAELSVDAEAFRVLARHRAETAAAGLDAEQGAAYVARAIDQAERLLADWIGPTGLTAPYLLLRAQRAEDGWSLTGIEGTEAEPETVRGPWADSPDATDPYEPDEAEDMEAAAAAILSAIATNDSDAFVARLDIYGEAPHAYEAILQAFEVEEFTTLGAVTDGMRAKVFYAWTARFDAETWVDAVISARRHQFETWGIDSREIERQLTMMRQGLRELAPRLAEEIAKPMQVMRLRSTRGGTAWRVEVPFGGYVSLDGYELRPPHAGYHALSDVAYAFVPSLTSSDHTAVLDVLTEPMRDWYRANQAILESLDMVGPDSVRHHQVDADNGLVVFEWSAGFDRELFTNLRGRMHDLQVPHDEDDFNAHRREVARRVTMDLRAFDRFLSESPLAQPAVKIRLVRENGFWLIAGFERPTVDLSLLQDGANNPWSALQGMLEATMRGAVWEMSQFFSPTMYDDTREILYPLSQALTVRHFEITRAEASGSRATVTYTIAAEFDESRFVSAVLEQVERRDHRAARRQAEEMARRLDALFTTTEPLRAELVRIYGRWYVEAPTDTPPVVDDANDDREVAPPPGD